MLFLVYILATKSVNKPDYLTETTTKHGEKSVKAWNINLIEFEKLLFPSDNSQTIKVTLPFIDKTYREYEIKPAHDLYSNLTHHKYPGKLFHFVGHEVGQPKNIVGFVYCFQYIKFYFVGHYQTLESEGSVNMISIIDNEDDNRFTSKRIREVDESLTDHLIKYSFDKQILEDFNPFPLDATLNVRMSEIKYIRYLLFPSIEYVSRLQSGRGITPVTSTNEIKKYVFSQLAASISFVNLIYHPQLAVHLEMVFDLDMIILQKTTADQRKYLKGSRNPEINTDNNLYKYAMQYFNIDDVDAGSIAHTGMSRGASSSSCMKPYSKYIMNSFTIDPMTHFGSFEGTLAHEIAHCLGTRHSFKYVKNSVEEGTEVGSGISIMGYPGRSHGNDVQGGQSMFFTWPCVSTMLDHIATNYHLKTEPKANRPPVIADMKTQFVIPQGTAFLLDGKATDPDGDTLNYQWENSDYCNESVSITTFFPNRTRCPIIRDYDPVFETYRFVPRLDRIKQGKLTDQCPRPEAWETVPTVARDLKFAFVVRDRWIQSWEMGNIVIKMINIKVVDGEPFSITSFNTAESIQKGSKRTVTWNVSNTDKGEINTKTVTIKFASDGEHFNHVLAANVPNNGSYEVTFPSQTTNNGRIMIQGDDNIFIAINRADIHLI